jgi:hypothetical protein
MTSTHNETNLASEQGIQGRVEISSCSKQMRSGDIVHVTAVSTKPPDNQTKIISFLLLIKSAEWHLQDSKATDQNTYNCPPSAAAIKASVRFVTGRVTWLSASKRTKKRCISFKGGRRNTGPDIILPACYLFIRRKCHVTAAREKKTATCTCLCSPYQNRSFHLSRSVRCSSRRLQSSLPREKQLSDPLQSLRERMLKLGR